MTDLTPDTFDSFVSKGVTLVDFHAEWCGPCRAMAPVLEKVTRARSLRLGKVDVDDCGSLAERYNVASLPTLVIFKNGEVVTSQVGAKAEQQLNAWLNTHAC